MFVWNNNMEPNKMRLTNILQDCVRLFPVFYTRCFQQGKGYSEVKMKCICTLSRRNWAGRIIMSHTLIDMWPIKTNEHITRHFSSWDMSSLFSPPQDIWEGPKVPPHDRLTCRKETFSPQCLCMIELGKHTSWWLGTPSLRPGYYDSYCPLLISPNDVW